MFWNNTIHQELQRAEKLLAAAHMAEPRLDARLLLEFAYAKDGKPEPHSLRYREQEKVPRDVRQKFRSYLGRRLESEPVARIMGEREFWSMPFRVTPAVLDPRADTETLVEVALKRIGPDRKNEALEILDFGTGSGCLLISMLKEFPNARGIGIDISFDAIKIAQENAERLGVASRAQFVVSDWSEAVMPPRSIDVLVANPPYIPETYRPALPMDVIQYDPPLSLWGGLTGLDAYAKLLPQVPYIIRPKSGMAIFEIGVEQRDAVTQMACQAGLYLLEIGQDIEKRDRCLAFAAK